MTELNSLSLDVVMDNLARERYGFEGWEDMRAKSGEEWGSIVAARYEEALDLYLLQSKMPTNADDIMKTVFSEGKDKPNWKYVTPTLAAILSWTRKFRRQQRPKTSYVLSKDYRRLFELVHEKQDVRIACFVDSRPGISTIPPMRDIAAVRMMGVHAIDIGVRGLCYGSWDRDYNQTVEAFEEICSKLNLEFIEPNN